MATAKSKLDLFELYESSVQDSVEDARFLNQLAKKECGRRAIHLREDFCGTFWLCHEWTKLSPQNKAMGIDLDSKAVAWGRRRRPDPQANARIQTKIQDVRKVTQEKFDLIAALNFSYFIFKERVDLLQYFKAARKSLRPGGLLTLDHFGGPAVFEPSIAPTKCKLPSGERFTFQWEEKNFNAATHHVDCAIHYIFNKRRPLKNAFTYPWRLWTLPELRDLLTEAGFKKVSFYFEAEDGLFRKRDTDANEYEQWIAYIAAKA